MVVATFRLRFWRFLAGIKLAATNVHGFSHSLDPVDETAAFIFQIIRELTASAQREIVAKRIAKFTKKDRKAPARLRFVFLCILA